MSLLSILTNGRVISSRNDMMYALKKDKLKDISLEFSEGYPNFNTSHYFVTYKGKSYNRDFEIRTEFGCIECNTKCLRRMLEDELPVINNLVQSGELVSITYRKWHPLSER